ncbi:MAG: hypothetical protein A2487_01000 [Candidatus Raymondbacteria bacterium RifOxyC12_full_50_8]|nr:MAG: hypothetical protein A2487_01000 [Candidatus Raymondbacteria bacterium RifOxyC12_full_50_8]
MGLKKNVICVLLLLVSWSTVFSSAYEQWRDSLPADYPTIKDYTRVLSKALRYAEENGFWHEADTIFMDYRGSNYAPAYSMALAQLIADPEYDSSISGLSKSTLMARVHNIISRSTNWYCSGQYAAIILQSIPDSLSQQEKDKMMYRIGTGRDGCAEFDYDPWGDTADTDIEYNFTPLHAYGAYCAFFPEDTATFRTLQQCWVEVAATKDMQDSFRLIGDPPKPINEWARGINFSSDFTGPNHFGFDMPYMFDPIATMGVTWTLMKAQGRPIPSTYYFNVGNLYDHCLKHYLLWDGVTVYPGGFDWTMYIRGHQSELLFYAGKKFMDNDLVAASLERSIFAHYEWRQKFLNGDLCGFSDSYVSNFSWLMTAMANCCLINRVNGPWTGGFASEAELNERTRGNHQAWVLSRLTANRTDNRFAKVGTGGWTILPRNGDHMGLWESGSMGQAGLNPFDNHGVDWGALYGTVSEFDEGFVSTKTACFAALPDKKSVLIYSPISFYEFRWKTQNWVFNDEQRIVYDSARSLVFDRTNKTATMSGRWFNVDDKIAYVNMHQSAVSVSEGSLTPQNSGVYWPGRYIGYIKFELLNKKTAFIVLPDATAEETRQYAQAAEYHVLATAPVRSGGVALKGQDGYWYLVMSNFTDSIQIVSATLPFIPTINEPVTGNALLMSSSDVSVSLAGYSSGIYRVGGAYNYADNAVKKETSCMVSVHPNPFNPVVKIVISGQATAVNRENIIISICNIQGAQVAALTARNSRLATGVTWDASSQPSGVYIVRLSMGGQKYSSKITLLK